MVPPDEAFDSLTPPKRKVEGPHTTTLFCIYISETRSAMKAEGKRPSTPHTHLPLSHSLSLSPSLSQGTVP